MDASHGRAPVAIPDFRNLGVILRCLVLAEFSSFIPLVAYSPDGFGALLRFSGNGLLFEFSVLLVLLVLFIASHWLASRSYPLATASVVFIAGAVGGGVQAALTGWLGGGAPGSVIKSAVLGALLAGLILVYFNWRQRILSPALAEARLMALQARIRPHFLFNSINTAVSLIRENPPLAERVLLDLSDLFRAALAERRLLVPLAEELSLARAYVEVEQLRLGERLTVRWECEGVSEDALVPFLLLQPLLENAIHHGIERCAGRGEVAVRIILRSGIFSIEVRNTLPETPGNSPAGNRMAVENIRERLALLFDAEAQFRAQIEQGDFVVRITFPASRERTQPGWRHG